MKTILTIMFLLGAAAAASAQGTVTFANTAATKVSTNGVGSGGTSGPTSPGIGLYYFALLVAPTNQTTVDKYLAGWTFTGNYANSTPATTGGRFSGGVVTVPGVGPGEAANFVVVGWSADAGHDWSVVYPQIMAGYGPGYVGMSAVATNVVLGDSGTPAPLFGFPPLLAGFTLYQGCKQPSYFYWLTRQLTNETITIGGTADFALEVEACPGPAAVLWFFNGSLIAGANDVFGGGVPNTAELSYQITNVGPTNAGQYFAVAYEPQWAYCCGSAYQTSSVATLTVVSPGITPAAQTAEAGAPVGFSAPAYGYPPQSFAWYFNRTQAIGNGDGAGTLLLTSVQPAQAGNYTLVITRPDSSVTNGPAALNVIPPVPRTLVPAVAVAGPTGGPVTLEYAASISAPSTWLALGTLDFTNRPQWCVDLSVPPPAERFYRAWRPVTFGSAPALSLAFAPALTISGTIGSAVRLDYINQFGPTNAWAPLSTITLTNSSQVYVDTSAIGQPPRLWRLVPAP